MNWHGLASGEVLWKGSVISERVFFVEKPSEEEVDRVEGKFGKAKRRIVTWDRRTVDYRREMEDPLCFGEVVLLIEDSDERLAIVRKRGSSANAWDTPTGIIEDGEGVEEASLREGYEETGRQIRVEKLAAIHQVRVHWKAWDVERWFFILKCTALSDVGTPEDTTEIEEVKWVRVPEELPKSWADSQWHRDVLGDGGLIQGSGDRLGRPLA